MGDDDEDGQRVINHLYMTIIKGYHDGDELEVARAKAKLEKQYRFENMVRTHILYSPRRGTVISYPEKVAEMTEQYEDMLFDLSDNSNESIKTIREFTVEEMVQFNKRVYKKLLRQSRHGRSE